MPQSPYDIKIATVGGTAQGFMLWRGRNGRRSYQVNDAPTIAPRILTENQITQAQLPPDLALTFPQDDWRMGIGGVLYRRHPAFLADAARIDVTERGVLKLARETTATTVDSNPNEYVASGFAVSGTQVWGFIGRDAYSWDFTNDQFDIQTEPVAATRIFRNAVNFEGRVYAPSWADDAGSGGSYTANDEPASYIYKTLSAAQWSVIATSAQSLNGCKYMTQANSLLWGGYWADAADSTLVAAPSFDAASSGNAGSDTVTVSHTCSTAANRLLLVWAASEDAAGNQATGVTYNSVAMTLVGTYALNNIRMTLWRLVAPSTGANNIVATWPDAQTTASVIAMSFVGVDQTTPLGTANGATGTSTTPSVVIAGESSDLIVDGVINATQGADPTVGAGQTERVDATAVNYRTFGSSEIATGASTTMDWTGAGNDDWISAGVAVRSAVRGASATVFGVSGTPSSQFVAGDVVRIDSELMLITTVTDSPGNITVVRGYRGSAAATHASGGLSIYEITENPHQVRSTADGTAMANWSTATSIGDSAAPITALVGVGSDLVVIKTDGVYRLEADGTVTNLRPEITAFGHEDFGKGAWAWNDKVFIPLHGGGLWELETNSWTVRDISFSISMPDQTQYHNRVVAGHGEPNRLYVMVAETANTRYHILMTENPDQTGLGDYNWSHVSAISYTTGTDQNHAALLLEAVTNGSNEHHRLLAGIESTGSNLLPRFIPHDSHDDDAEYASTDAEAYTVAYDAGFPNILKRAQKIVCNTDNLGATGGTNHYIEVRYRVDGGAWTYVTGTQATSTLTSDNQTLTFASAITFYKIEFRFTFVRRTTGNNTTPELHDFTFTCQLRTDSIKLLPLSLYIANGQLLRNGMMENQARTKRNQLRTWNAQGAEVVLTDTELGTRNVLFLPGRMRETEVSNGYHAFPEYKVDVMLAEVGS